jgi:serine/threonine protein kinase
MAPDHSLTDKTVHKLECEWRRLCDDCLPVRPKHSLWWYSRKKDRDDLSQGWKLHVSGTILSASRILKLIAPCLRQHQVLFKAPHSITELHKLNSGLSYGFSQVGKFITVYPPSTGAAVTLARDLDRLTANQSAPQVPYDEALREGSCVHYRYGQFCFDLDACIQNGQFLKIMRPDGRRIPDRREPGAAVPRWLTDPFRRGATSNARTTITALETNYSDYEAIVQRGRGGVYRALDLSAVPKKICIIKEGRKHGETDWLGRDGIDRVKQEALFLKTVSRDVGGVPRFITTFRANHSYYLVMEHIAGRSLQSVITSRERVSTSRALKYCLNMARILADIHSAGWAWLDCKPGNFLCGKNHELHAIDFEGACRPGERDPLGTETPGYVPPKRNAANLQADDLYALGVSFVQLIGRRSSPPLSPVSFKTKIRGQKLPEAFIEATKNLLQPDPKKRPAARTVQSVLEKELQFKRQSLLKNCS